MADNTVPNTVALMPGRNGGALKRGNPGNRGGNGRKPAKIVQLAQTITDKYQLLDIARAIAVGDIWEEWTNGDGETISAPTKNSDRLAAIRLIVEYAHGKPSQPVDLTAELILRAVRE